MTKQEFLAMSLPYGLKVYDCIGNSIEVVDYSKGCPKCVCEAIGQVKNENKCINVFQAAYDKQLKPILHPLSDLTKEIEYKGEKFIPIEKLGFENTKEIYESILYTIEKECFPVSEFFKLIKMHFDVVGLIEKGEAMDINTLKKTHDKRKIY